jgi:hypothetical protein
MILSETQDWARRILEHEAVAGKTSYPAEPAAFRVYEKLRQPLCAVAGVAGFRSLGSRALMLAKAETPSLGALQVAADGSLQGLGRFEQQFGKDRAEEGQVVFIAQLLGLLLALIGKDLTLRLLPDVSPDLELPTTSDVFQPFEDILQEAGQLKNVCERLESLADQHPIVEDALTSISGNIRDTATVLEVLVQIRGQSDTLPNNPLKQPAKHYKM